MLRLVAEGQSNKAIGVSMGLSALTVKSHLARIARKLGTGDRAGIGRRRPPDGHHPLTAPPPGRAPMRLRLEYVHGRPSTERSVDGLRAYTDTLDT
ncbi:hypothetical protein SBADM41S_12062 [Streptomyces badius]